LGGDQSPLCFLGQAWIWSRVLTSLMSGAPLPLLVPALHWVPLRMQGPHPDSSGGWIPHSDQAVHWCLVGSLSCGLGICILVTREGDNSPSPWSQTSPQEMLREVTSWDMRLWGKQQEAMFYCASTDSADSCPNAEPREQRGLTLYALESRLHQQKARSNPYMVIFNFIGYFILVLRDFPLPDATWPSSYLDFSGFLSLLCHLYLPATFPGLRPNLFSFDPPPCYTLDPVSKKKIVKSSTQSLSLKRNEKQINY
jgi:hypothetical protein